MTTIDVDDLALLAGGFRAALQSAPDAGSAAVALFDLGWPEALDASPAQAMATAFAAQGDTGATAGLLDDVVVHRLGLEPAPTTAIVLPAPGERTPPAVRRGDRVVVDGMASSRLDHADTVVLPVVSGTGTELVTVAADALAAPATDALDPTPVFRRVRADLDAAATTPASASGTWGDAVAAGRVALAHELLALARTMLDQARDHAVDRVQFGRAVASFQAVRHKLAEVLVAIEGADGVAEAAGGGDDPLLAALAKSLAGQAGRTAAAHAQQVLAGMGFTTDHPFHRVMKRTLVLDVVLGSAATLPAEIGAELLRQGGAPRLVELGTDR